MEGTNWFVVVSDAGRRKTELARRAEVWLQLRPGTDDELALARRWRPRFVAVANEAQARQAREAIAEADASTRLNALALAMPTLRAIDDGTLAFLGRDDLADDHRQLVGLAEHRRRAVALGDHVRCIEVRVPCCCLGAMIFSLGL